MSHGVFHVHLLDPTEKYVANLLESEKAAVLTDIEALKDGKDVVVKTKQLRGPIRELIVGNHRITYFKIDRTLYFARGFRKKTRKTPHDEIEYAYNSYKQLSM